MAARGCPDEDRLVRFVAGNPDADERDAIEQHIDACADCRIIIAELSRLRALPPEPVAEAAPNDDALLAAPLVRGASVGRYLIVGLVGVGGMGAVYEAYDPELDRKLAIKILRNPPDGETTRGASARLLREARALAKLVHPNVVTVYDVGDFGNQIFIAMEFIAGVTLAEWLGQTSRSWRQIRDVFIEAGKGLQAAHAAGLVHRDFKPDNVLLARDGRVLVTDFGLARAFAEPKIASDESSKPSIGDSRLTATGALVGTPVYMAPEQHAGSDPDARSDQYQFCVALYEALAGTHPFRTDSIERLEADKSRGRVAPWPSRSKLPSWLKRAVEKGLRPDPNERHASMSELDQVLVRDRRLRRGPLYLLVPALALLGGGLYWQHQRAAERVCQDGADRLHGVWDASTRSRVEAAFGRSGLPYAPTMFASVSKILDAYGAEWVRQRTETCEATHVHHEQSQAMLDLRTGCLDERRESLRTLVELLANADSALIQRSVQASGALADPRSCRGQELAKPVELPSDPAVVGRIVELRLQNARVHVHWLAGRFADAKQIIEPASVQARELGYQPLIAETEYELAITKFRLGDVNGTIDALERSIWAAEAGRHDKLAAQARGWLVVPYAAKRQFAEGRRARRYAEAALARIGGDPVLEARLDQETAVLAIQEGNYAEAVTRARAALDSWQKIHGSEHHEVATARAILGVSLILAGDYEQAERHTRQALELDERLLGRDHPNNTGMLINLGHILGRTGRVEEELALSRRALSIQERSVGPNQPGVALALSNLGDALMAQTKYALALEQFERARTIREQKFGKDSVELASSLCDIARVELETGQPDRALARAEQARSLLEQRLGREHLDVRKVWTLLGRIFAGLRRFEESATIHRQSLELAEKKLGQRHVDVAIDCLGLGQAELGRGRFADAERWLGRAITIWKAGKVDPLELAEAELTLSIVLENSGRAGEAGAMADAAKRAFEKLGRADRRSEIEARLDRRAKLTLEGP